jgi:hypothetical protein
MGRRAYQSHITAVLIVSWVTQRSLRRWHHLPLLGSTSPGSLRPPPSDDRFKLQLQAKTAKKMLSNCLRRLCSGMHQNSCKAGRLGRVKQKTHSPKLRKKSEISELWKSECWVFCSQCEASAHAPILLTASSLSQCIAINSHSVLH